MHIFIGSTTVLHTLIHKQIKFLFSNIIDKERLHFELVKARRSVDKIDLEI